MDHLSEIIKILRLKGVTKKITLKTNLSELGIDSLDLMDCVVEAEEKLNIHINDDKIMDIKTVQDFINVIKSSEV